MAKINSDIFGFDIDEITDEDFLVEVEVSINRIMAKKKINKATLAELLGVSKPRISQLLSSAGQNMTLKTLASIFSALDERVEITSTSLRELNKAVQERVRRKEELRIQFNAQKVWLPQPQKDDFEHFEAFTAPKHSPFAFRSEGEYNSHSVRRVRVA